jgi:hypothetical protein
MTQNPFLARNSSIDLAPNPCAGRDPVAVQSEFTLSNVEGSEIKPPRHLSGGNINQKTKKMQNKPNLSLRRQGSSSTINPYSARRYKNFTRHSVSEGGPKQTQNKPNPNPNKANFKRPTPPKIRWPARRSLGEDGSSPQKPACGITKFCKAKEKPKKHKENYGNEPKR